MDTAHQPAPAISGKTRVFLVLGDPVSQVQAPGIFNAIFRRYGVDAVLVPAQVSSGNVVGFVRHVMAAGNIDGLWVTIPHKPALASLACRRRCKSDPPCRSKIDPGMRVDRVVVGCGQV